MYQSSVLNAAIKIIFFVHLVFTTWGLQSDWSPNSYFFYNTMFLLILLWGLHEKESEEPITIAFWMNMICIFLDVISIGVHFPTSSASTSKRFSAGMAIVNLLLRPISSFFLYHILQDRGVQFKDPSEFTHEVDAFESVSSPKSRSPYQDIDKVGHPQISQPIPVAELDSDHH